MAGSRSPCNDFHVTARYKLSALLLLLLQPYRERHKLQFFANFFKVLKPQPKDAQEVQGLQATF